MQYIIVNGFQLVLPKVLAGAVQVIVALFPSGEMLVILKSVIRGDLSYINCYRRKIM